MFSSMTLYVSPMLSTSSIFSLFLFSRITSLGSAFVSCLTLLQSNFDQSNRRGLLGQHLSCKHSVDDWVGNLTVGISIFTDFIRPFRQHTTPNL